MISEKQIHQKIIARLFLLFEFETSIDWMGGERKRILHSFDVNCFLLLIKQHFGHNGGK